MTKLFNRWLPCATLFSWSAILLGFYFSGRVDAYLHPAFRPGVLIAGGVMLALAAAFAFLPGVASGCVDENCGQPLGKMKGGRFLTFFILLLPFGTASLYSPQSFSATTIMNRGVVTDARGLASQKTPAASPSNPLEPALPTKDGAPAAPEQAAAANDFLPKSKEGNVLVAVVDLLYAAQDPSLRPDFENKKVELIGQIMPDNVSNSNGRRFKLVRMFMVCCAADARPVAALIESDKKPDAAEMTWVKIVGSVNFPIESGRPIAVVKADSVTVTNPPDETMLY